MNQEAIPTLAPRLKVLTREQAEAIHHAALEILGRTGFRMEHAGARDILTGLGCQTMDDGWMTMPAELPEKALESAPKRIELFTQTGESAMCLEGDRCYYGTGSDAIFTLDLESGERRQAVLADVRSFARLVDGLEHIDFVMSMANPKDADPKNIYVAVFAEIIKNTDKPVVFIADRGEDIALIHEMAAIVAGGKDKLRKKPFLLNYSEAISPLRFPENVVEKLIYCSRHGIPLCFPSGSNAGGGAPVTLAGAMAMGIAENLVGLVIHQAVNPGAPFLFGPNVSALDMKSTVVCYGCPEWSLTQAALADMRDEIYGLPIWAYAGASDAKVVDAQAGAEAMFSICTGLLSRANLMHDVGFLEFGSTSSLEMITMANELIAMSKFFVKGIPVNEETLALETIEKVAKGGPGSIFLTEDHTFDHFMTSLFLPSLLDRSRFDSWKDTGGADMYTRCNREARRVLKEHCNPVKPVRIVDEIDKVVTRSR